jgi:membrane protein
MDRFARLLAGVDRFQQRHRIVGLPIAVSKRFGEHGGGRLAATISYYAFFSLFPLLLVFVTILGIVLENNQDLRQQLIDGAVGQIPVIGSQLRTDSLPGDGWVLVVGIVGAVWAGLGAVMALQHALDTIDDVPLHARGNAVLKRLKAVAFLALLAVGIALTTTLSNAASLLGGGVVTGVLGIAATFLVNALLMAMTLTVLPAQRHSPRATLPGVLVGALGLVILQQLGSIVVRHFIAGANDTYGTFAIVIALLSWFFLVTRVVLMSAELNVVLAHGLHPRRLVAAGEPTDADRKATMLDVQSVQRDARVGYALSVDGSVATDDDPLAESDQPLTSR